MTLTDFKTLQIYSLENLYKEGGQICVIRKLVKLLEEKKSLEAYYLANITLAELQSKEHDKNLVTFKSTLAQVMKCLKGKMSYDLYCLLRAELHNLEKNLEKKLKEEKETKAS